MYMYTSTGIMIQMNMLEKELFFLNKLKKQNCF